MATPWSQATPVTPEEGSSIGTRLHPAGRCALTLVRCDSTLSSAQPMLPTCKPRSLGFDVDNDVSFEV